MALGLQRLPDIRLERLPRMADFALWASACETAIWPAGTFWFAYCANRDEAVENVIEDDPVAAAVRALMAERTEWTGTATDLVSALAEKTGERVAKSKTWSASPRALSGRLRRAATFLRKVGIGSTTSRKDERATGSLSSRRKETLSTRVVTGRNRPHRLHRLRSLRMAKKTK